MQEAQSGWHLFKRPFHPGWFRLIKSWGFWIGLSIVLTLFLHLWSLTRYPNVSDDEVWLVSRAWAYIQTGHQIGPLDDAGLGSSTGSWIMNQWLITFLQAGVLRLFSAPNLIALRALSLVFGFGLLGVNYWTASRLGGRWLAIVSTLLLALSWAFFHSAHLVRYDILAALFCYLSLAIVVNNRRSRFLVSLAAGFILALGIETHLNSLIFIPVIGVYFLIEYGLKVFHRASVWGFAAGLGLGAIHYLALHVFPYPQIYFQKYTPLLSQTLQPPILTFDIKRIAQAFVDVGNLFLAAAGPMVILIILAVIFVVIRQTRLDKKILLLNVTLVITAALVIPLKNGHYAILLAPAAIWWAASALQVVLDAQWRKRIFVLMSRALAIGTVVGTITLSLFLLQNNGYQDFKTAQASVSSNIKPADRIIGPQAYWLGLYDHRYISWEFLFVYTQMFKGSTLKDAFAYYKPDIFIIDSQLDNLIIDNVDPSTQWYNNILPRKELEDFLRENAIVVSDALKVDPNFIVYRIQWK